MSMDAKIEVLIDRFDQSCYSMIMLHYTITEAKAKFAEVVEKAMAGEEIIVTKMGKPSVKISPYVPEDKSAQRIGFMKTPYYISANFDELPEEIARAFGMIE